MATQLAKDIVAAALNKDALTVKESVDIALTARARMIVDEYKDYYTASILSENTDPDDELDDEDLDFDFGDDFDDELEAEADDDTVDEMDMSDEKMAYKDKMMKKKKMQKKDMSYKDQMDKG